MSPRGLIAVAVSKDLIACYEVGLRLDCASAYKDLPVVFSGLKSERGGKDDDVASSVAKSPEQLGKSDVVADRAAKGKSAEAIRDDFAAATDPSRFQVSTATGNLNIK